MNNYPVIFEDWVAEKYSHILEFSGDGHYYDGILDMLFQAWWAGLKLAIPKLVRYEDFIEAWNSSRKLDRAAEKLGLTIEETLAQAKLYNKELRKLHYERKVTKHDNDKGTI
jgi:hypothetical protein